MIRTARRLGAVALAGAGLLAALPAEAKGFKVRFRSSAPSVGYSSGGAAPGAAVQARASEGDEGAAARPGEVGGRLMGVFAPAPPSAPVAAPAAKPAPSRGTPVPVLSGPPPAPTVVGGLRVLN